MDGRLEQLMKRGREAYERRDYAAALEAFRGVLRERPGFADLRNLAGLCLSLLGRAEEALAEFDRALVINPDYAEAHLHRSLVLHELGRYDEARAALERAGQLETASEEGLSAAAAARLANAHAEVGDLYLASSMPVEAAVQYRAALELRPHFVDIRRKLALAHLELSELDEAETELRECLAMNPRFFEALVDLGVVHARRGQDADAESVWREVLVQRPSHTRARAGLSMLEQRRAAHGVGEG